jgi:ABC-type phosphate transport system auxiliary subunit
MISPRLVQLSGAVAAFALGVMLASPATRLVPGAAAAPAESKILSRPAPIQVTPVPNSDPVSQLQQRVASLEETLVGPSNAGGRPRPDNVIGALQAQVQALQSSAAQAQNQEFTELSKLEQKLAEISLSQQSTQLQLTQLDKTAQVQLQVLHDLQGRLGVVCKTLLDHVKGQLQYDSLMQCTAAGYNPDVVAKLTAPFY